MDNDRDMEQPVTKRELRQELAEFRTELRAELQQGLSFVIDTLTARMAELRTDIMQHVSTEIARATTASKEEMMRHLSTEFAKATSASNDQHRDQLTVIDDKYKDLPPRVARLERAVFPPKPTRQRRR